MDESKLPEHRAQGQTAGDGGPRTPSAPTPQEVMALVPDAICVVDGEGRFLAIHGACEAIFGYAPGEMVGRRMVEFIHAPDLPRTLQAVGRIMGGYLQRHFENRYVRKDGRLVHIMWSARWCPEKGVRVAVARDVTARRDAEARAETLQPAAGWSLRSAPRCLVPPGLGAIPLSAQDHAVLHALAAKAPAVVRRQSIVQALGHDYLHYDQRRLDTQMRRLRRRVQEACGLQLPVTTVRGVGYRFFEAIEIAARTAPQPAQR